MINTQKILFLEQVFGFPELHPMAGVVEDDYAPYRFTSNFHVEVDHARRF